MINDYSKDIKECEQTKKCQAQRIKELEDEVRRLKGERPSHESATMQMFQAPASVEKLTKMETIKQ